MAADVSRRRRSVTVVAVVAVLIAAAVAFGAVLGAWYLPFVAGAGAGVATRRWRLRWWWTAAVLVVLGPLAWGATLAGLALTGARVTETATVVAALAGLPALADVTIALTVLVALLQTMTGAWLGRAVAPAVRR